ncbi:MAG: SprT family zinc-dependent metalloprotease [Mariprofundaceae bacterium]|nr:SprT family zinc-dependent metalloprotease [Mariprofundaceae bacterium]
MATSTPLGHAKNHATLCRITSFEVLFKTMSQTLPHYDVRISKRAKHARLQIKPNGVLEVVLPETMNPNQAANLIRSHQDWIFKHQQSNQTKQTNHEPIYVRPNSIDLPLLKETITIKYIASDINAYEEDNDELTVSFISDMAITKILQHWLKHRATMCFSAMLFGIAQEMDESYKSVSIRLQKTRWGSCSNQRRINLNAKLLLLPEGLIRYVMVHELSHLQHLNHSAEFWQRVAEFEPDYLIQRQKLHAWSRQQPYWLY